ncbi:MAG: hypothetical protein LBL15_02135 [Oscillospiraceae bacterium]|jgi:ABC-2 type transport system permease protein|nr:hypothetical protein [Oscillospiraceae bacterium]
MKSKTSFFNRTLFFELPRRFWPILAAYVAVWLVVLPVATANNLQYYLIDDFLGGNLRVLLARAGQNILEAGLYGGLILSAGFALILAMAAFSYLYTARSVSMYCSLPIRREGVFLSLFGSGLFWLFAGNAVIALVTIGVVSAYGLPALAGFVLQWFAMTCLFGLFYFGFAALCASLTGHVLVLPLVYAVLNFTVYVVEYLVRTAMSLFIYGVSVRGSLVLSPLSPPVHILDRTSVRGILERLADGGSVEIGCFYDGWTALICYGAAGLFCALAAVQLIRRRRMETAGDVVAVKPLKPVFKYCLSFGCALVIGLLIYTAVFGSETYGIARMVYMLLFMLFGAFVGYFAAEMLMRKTLRVFNRKNWLHLGAAAVIIAALMFCGEFDVFGIERKLPAADRLERVSVSCNGQSVNFEQADNIGALIALHGEIIAQKDINERKAAGFDLSPAYGVQITYFYKDARTLSRNYTIFLSSGTTVDELNALLNVPEAVNDRKNISIPVTPGAISDAFLNYFDKETGEYSEYWLSAEQAYALYTDCIVPDIDDGYLGKIWLVTDDAYYSGVYDCTFNFAVSQRRSDGGYAFDHFYTTLTRSAARSAAWVTENTGIALSTMGESREITTGEKAAVTGEGFGY